ncbi:hypothetical protein O1400_09980 [Bacteroides fragilis]|uniref:hypothetical protein n=1 Tax=Bacteroides TaxID=816 RepID=UPI0022AA6CB6|nr:hypothetical protein [Bacteroides fragilis]MCX8462176.1 hypothetical protein [Bacteroides fragilis]MCZ2602679.1 hypothetical protein [Bacteroides fragilis]
MGYYKNNPGAQRGHKVVDIDASQVVKLLNEIDIENAIPKTERKKILRNAMKITQKAVREGYRSSVYSDPRKAIQGVKISVYREGMGATVSLNNPKSGRSSKVVRASITRTGGASGILRHRKRSERTEQIDGYWGRDRAFILRFINKGTIERVAFKRTRSKSGRTANRGIISARGFFRRSVDGAKVATEQYLAGQLNTRIASCARSAGAEVKK